MKLKYTTILAIASAIFTSGCNGIGGLTYANWSSAQKKEFLQILRQDRYSSICDMQDMILQYSQTKDEKILNKLLIKYAENLENSCIDKSYFKEAIKEKKEQNITTYFEFYDEYVDSDDIMKRVKKRESINSILSTYIPSMPQFFPLINAYNTAASPAQKYKIKLNIERVKLLKSESWDTYALINIPEYKFRFFENRQKVMEFRTIVGRPTWQTPIFSSVMKYITVHPTWNVPDNIARKEIISRIIKDSSYLENHNMVIKKDYAINSPTIDPSKIDWEQYLTPKWSKKELPYKIIEQSGSANALGNVKFMFPNRFAVYMHDTNNKRLFNRRRRAFSHGCIRLQKPLNLLGYLSSYYTKAKFEDVGTFLKAEKIKFVSLTTTIPVHIIYLTAYIKGGKVNFFNDVYGFDKITKLNISTK